MSGILNRERMTSGMSLRCIMNNVELTSTLLGSKQLDSSMYYIGTVPRVQGISA